MNHSDIAALMKGVAPVIRDLIAAAVKPLVDERDDLKRQIAELKAIDHAEVIRAGIAVAVAALPPPRDGADGAPGRDGLDGQPGRDGADGKDGAPGADGKDGIDGKDGAPGERGADGLPGRDGEPGAPGRDGADGINGKDGEQGREGPAGKLPLVKAWVDGVHREGDVVTHGGATYQALRDTGKDPSHEDWQCIAAAGRDGVDGRSFRIRGTHAEGSDYAALDVVSLNGGAFVAKKDDPGPCPGDGWQLIASQGKRGQPGERGVPGRGDKGPPGEPVVAAHIDDQGMLTLVNGDGSKVEVDLYPILSKIAG